MSRQITASNLIVHVPDLSGDCPPAWRCEVRSLGCDDYTDERSFVVFELTVRHPGHGSVSEIEWFIHTPAQVEDLADHLEAAAAKLRAQAAKWSETQVQAAESRLQTA